MQRALLASYARAKVAAAAAALPAPPPPPAVPPPPVLESNRAWTVKMVAHMLQVAYRHHVTMTSGDDMPFDAFLAALGVRWAETQTDVAEHRRAHIIFFQKEMLPHRALIEDVFPSEVVDDVRILRLGMAGSALMYCLRRPPTTSVEMAPSARSKTNMRVRFADSEADYFRDFALFMLDEMQTRAMRPPIVYAHEIPPLPGMDETSAACYRLVVGMVGPGLATLYDPAFYWARTGIAGVSLGDPLAEPPLADDFVALLEPDGRVLFEGARRIFAEVQAQRGEAAPPDRTVMDVVCLNMRWGGRLALAADAISECFQHLRDAAVPFSNGDIRAAEAVLQWQWRVWYHAGVCAALSGDAGGAATLYMRAHDGFRDTFGLGSITFAAFLCEELCMLAYHAPSHARVIELLRLFSTNVDGETQERVDRLTECARMRALENEKTCKTAAEARVAERLARYAEIRDLNMQRRAKAREDRLRKIAARAVASAAKVK